MDDIGLQRAIYASLAGNGGGGGSSSSRPLPTSSSNANNFRRPAPQVAAGGGGGGTATDWGLRGGASSSSSSSAFMPMGRRNQLEREGIMPRGQGQTFQAAGKVGTKGPIHKADPFSSGGDNDEIDFNAKPSPKPASNNSRGFYDRLIHWKEMTVGGRSQAQNPAQDHILLVTEETLPDRISSFQGTEGLLISREEPVDMSLNPRGCTMKLTLKSLTGSGKYSTFAIGFSTRNPCDGSARGFMGLSIHYEFTGAVYVSVDEWSIARDTSSSSSSSAAAVNVYRKLERTVTLEKAQQVKPKRDGLEIKVPFTNRSIDVIINDHLHFKNVMAGVELGGDSDDVYVSLFASGGRFSAKHLEILEGLESGSGHGSCSSLAIGRTPTASPPPLAPRANRAAGGSSGSGSAGAIAGRRAPSRQIGTGAAGGNAAGRVGANYRSASNGPSARSSQSPSNNAMRGGSQSNNAKNNKQQQQQHNNNPNYNPDDPFIQMIEAEIIDRSPNVTWDDIAGVADAKAVLNEAVILPLLVPELFTGVRQPWKGVLLYGPPGTGKTMLAKGVATSAKTTFYSISASTLLSRFHGESEKLVKALFQSARANAPSTIFFDEIDAIMSKRGGQNEHEASRRLKAEMLQQIDGVGSSVTEGRVMLLAATNTPWDLDEAMRRRLEKRIYVPLPDEGGRLEFLRRQTEGPSNSTTNPSGGGGGTGGNMSIDPSIDLAEIARLTDGYSGADMTQVCRDAAMMPMRRLIADKTPMQIAEMRMRGQALSVTPVTREDFMTALQKVKPSVSKDELGKYEDWTKEFSSV